MKRREFITLLAGATTWSLAVRAQESGRTYRLGFLVPSPKDSQPMAAFFDELRREGFIERQNLEILPGGFDAGNEKLSELAAALAQAMPDAIVAGPVLPLRALQAATRTVPLIGLSEDLVAEGLVTSLARPGGNITGISLLAPELDGKRQDILIEAIAGARRIAALFDSRVTPPSHLHALESAARSRGVSLSTFGVNGPEDVGAAIDEAKASGAEGLNFLSSPLFAAQGSRIYQIVMERTAAVRLPAIFQWPEMAEAGAVLGYGPPVADVYRQRARLTAKVLRGAKPADLPVEQPTKFELVINLKTSKAIGHEVPVGLVLRADKVIE